MWLRPNEESGRWDGRKSFACGSEAFLGEEREKGHTTLNLKTKGI